MDAPENINLLGGEGSGIPCKAHFMKEVCFLPTPALLKINSTVLESYYWVQTASKAAAVVQV